MAWHKVPECKKVRAERAFTLVEVLLAVALLSIIVTVMYSAFHTMGRIMLRNEQTKGAYQTARLIMARMRQDLSCARYSPTLKNFTFSGEDVEGEVIGGDDRGADAVTFVTSAHVISGRDAPEGDLAEVSYYLDEYNPGIFVRREDVSPDDELETGGILQILGKNVVGLNFTYLDGREETSRRAGQRDASASAAAGEDETLEERKAWKDEWDSNETPYLPRAVRIDLSVENEEGEIEDFSTTVVLAMGRTETSILPTLQQAPGRGGATPRGGMRGPTQLRPGGPRGGPRGGEREGRRDAAPGRGRGGDRRGTGRGPGSTGRGPRPPSPATGSRSGSPGTPTIRRNVPTAGSGPPRPPTPGGRR
jgi:prepilin-type N-terminal cleavage/methylation domain-containing protein